MCCAAGAMHVLTCTRRPGPLPLDGKVPPPVPEDEIITCDGCGLGWTRDDPAMHREQLWAVIQWADSQIMMGHESRDELKKGTMVDTGNMT